MHDRVSLGDDEVSPIDQHLDHGVDPFEGSETEEHLRHVRRLRAESHARSTASQRRRQVQQVLIGLTVLSLILLVMGVLPFLLAVLPALGLAAFVYASRGSAKTAKAGQARTRRASERDARREQEPTSRERRSSSARRTSSQRSSASRRSSSASRRRGAGRHVDAPAARTGSVQYADVEGADVRMLSNNEVQGRRASAATEGRWEPVEAPLPGYLESARATRVPRNLDSTANGDWTSERMLEQAEALRTPGADAEYELGLDEFVDIPGIESDDDHGYGHRRAVND